MVKGDNSEYQGDYHVYTVSFLLCAFLQKGGYQ